MKIKRIIKHMFSRTAVLAALLVLGSYHMVMVKSESHIRRQVVTLTSGQGLCSGEHIIAPSGESYILTAAHCEKLAKDGQILATDDEGRSVMRRVIAIDTKSDLMLLEAMPGHSGLNIAAHASPKQHVRTFTHGRRMPTYKTEGELIGNVPVQFIINLVTSKEEADMCKGGALSVETVPSLFGEMQACVFSALETATTAKTVPGSSGGPVVDDRGDLVGVVSAGDRDGAFGYLVRLQDIQDFVSNY